MFVSEVLLAVVVFGCTPGMVGGTSEMGEEEPLILRQSFVDHVFDIRADLGLGVAEWR